MLNSIVTEHLKKYKSEFIFRGDYKGYAYSFKDTISQGWFLLIDNSDYVLKVFVAKEIRIYANKCLRYTNKTKLSWNTSDDLNKKILDYLTEIEALHKTMSIELEKIKLAEEFQ